MKTTALKSLLTAIVLSVAPTMAHADEGEAVFTRDTGAGTHYSFGTSKKENYDLAVMLAGSGIKGKTIKAVEVPFNGTPNISNLKVWLTKKLTLNGKTNAPDILSVDVDALTGTVAKVTLPEPYTIEGDTVYVGYSFDVTTLDNSNKKPVQLCSELADGGCFVHSSRTYRSWIDYSSTASLTVRVTLGGVKADAATFAGLEKLHGQFDKATDVTVSLANAGSTAISSIDYIYEQGSVSGQGHIDFAKPIPAIFGATKDTTVSLPAAGAKGVYPVKLSIAKVNGQANPEADKVATGSIDVYTLLPKHRAVVEEYTGTWCGWCPRGLVALEVLSRLYPDDFIGISYHNGDDMEIMAASQFPNSVSGFPYAVLDRQEGADPYYGVAQTTAMDIENDWKRRCAEFAPADVATTAYLSDDRTSVEMTTTVTFPVADDNANYKVEYILVSDSLYNESWGQSNYFANGSQGGAETYAEPEFEVFYKGGSYVYGLYYPDVIIATSRLNGTNGTLPSSIKEDEEDVLSYSFDLSKAVNTSGAPLVQNYNALRVVALLLDGSGKIVNAAKSKVYADVVSGIHSAKADASVEPSKVVYDLSGRRLSQLSKGLNIVRTASGKTLKVIGEGR